MSTHAERRCLSHKWESTRETQTPLSQTWERGGGEGYAELHCVSNFTFLRGASHPEELVERAKELNYAALAITDECSLAGVVRAHVAAKECVREIRCRMEMSGTSKPLKPRWRLVHRTSTA